MQAHNGSGKTTCFTLGMLARVDPAVLAPQALCVCPTRELVVQNQMVLERMGKFTGGWVGAGQGQGVMCVLLVGRKGVLYKGAKHAAVQLGWARKAGNWVQAANVAAGVPQTPSNTAALPAPPRPASGPAPQAFPAPAQRRRTMRPLGDRASTTRWGWVGGRVGGWVGGRVGGWVGGRVL